LPDKCRLPDTRLAADEHQPPAGAAGNVAQESVEYRELRGALEQPAGDVGGHRWRLHTWAEHNR
jgi:hypothetical protein